MSCALHSTRQLIYTMVQSRLAGIWCNVILGRAPEDVVEESRIARAPRGRESVKAQLKRLLDAHEIVSQVVRTNELQSWFVGEHLQTHDERSST